MPGDTEWVCPVPGCTVQVVAEADVVRTFSDFHMQDSHPAWFVSAPGVYRPRRVPPLPPQGPAPVRKRPPTVGQWLAGGVGFFVVFLAFRWLVLWLAT